ncbi:MAG TPA: TonB-dependent receptor plug domain-containing protein [Saprospiraceae bacterium]|nr:TonB-dependent receptor plug domain-containing protein [Saprospiraceae bacterium]
MRIRKLLKVLLLLIVFQVIGYSQKSITDTLLTYNSNNKGLDVVLNELSNMSGVNIVYSGNRVNSTMKSKGFFKNETLSTILQVILDDYKLSFTEISGQVIIRESELVSQSYNVYGYIRNKDSDEPLPYSNVYLESGAKGVETNDDGFYNINLPYGENRLIVSYVGFIPDTVDFFSRKDTLIKFFLKPATQLNEIRVNDSIVQYGYQEYDYSTIEIDHDKLTNGLHLGGEADILRVLNTKPGVSSGADGFGGYSIRGGNTDQNLVLLDGVPVYNSGHALGLLSTFNPSTIQSAKLYKSSFPARFGGRLSSVLDINTRDGNYRKLGGEVGLSVLAAKLLLEGPIVKDKASFMVSMRRSFADPWIKGISKYQIESNGGRGLSNFFFYDVNVKFNARIGENHKVEFGYYRGNDDFKHNSFKELANTKDYNSLNWNWGNHLYALHLNSSWSKYVFSRIYAFSSEYNSYTYENQQYVTDTEVIKQNIFEGNVFSTDLQSKGINISLDILTGKKHYIKIGGILEKKVYKPGLKYLNNRIYDIKDSEIITADKYAFTPVSYQFSESRIYLEDEIDLNSVILNVGLQSAIIGAEEKLYSVFEPRFSLSIPGKALSLKMGVSKMSQAFHVLSTNELGLPNDLWIPVTKYIDPSTSWNFEISPELKIKDGIHTGLSLFYNIFDNLKHLPEGNYPDVVNDSDWDRHIVNGTGKSYGVEFYFNKAVGRTNFDLNYTFQKSLRQFDNINQDNEFTFRYNRNHNIKFSLNRKLTENALFNMIYNYSSGNYVTVPSSDIIIVGSGSNTYVQKIYKGLNNEQLPNYHRLDLGFSFFNKMKFGRQKLFLGVYNIFNSNNVLFIDIKRDPNNANKFEKIKYSILPVFPTFSYSLAF